MPWRGDGARDLHPVHARARHLERGQHEVAQHLFPAGDLELGQREAGASRRRQHHVHRQPAAALGHEPLLGGGHHLGGGLARRVVLVPDLEAALVDADGVAHADELRLALDGTGEVVLDVEGDEVEAVERGVVAHGHDVVEPVDADAAPPGVPRLLGDRLARARVEHLLERRRAVLADVAGLGGEDDERLAVGGDDDVGVAVDDLEAGEVGHRPFEPGVLAAGDDEGVEPVLAHGSPNVGVASLELRC